MSEKPLPYITEELLLKTGVINSVYSDMETNYYWSDNFSPNFYMLLAKLGFISTATVSNGMELLLPEIQKAYAVLHFKDLHISRKVKRLLKEDTELKLEKSLDRFTQDIINYHGDECWLTPDYIRCIKELESATLEDHNFEWVIVNLYKNGEVVAGELGYFIGKTYTSLTGFCNRSIPGTGTLQMIKLAWLLENIGIDYWNMGHPYMEYKTKLGAKIYNRYDFLQLWSSSTQITGNYLSNLLN